MMKLLQQIQGHIIVLLPLLHNVESIVLHKIIGRPQTLAMGTSRDVPQGVSIYFTVRYKLGSMYVDLDIYVAFLSI